MFEARNNENNTLSRIVRPVFTLDKDTGPSVSENRLSIQKKTPTI